MSAASGTSSPPSIGTSRALLITASVTATNAAMIRIDAFIMWMGWDGMGWDGMWITDNIDGLMKAPQKMYFVSRISGTSQFSSSEVLVLLNCHC